MSAASGGRNGAAGGRTTRGAWTMSSTSVCRTGTLVALSGATVLHHLHSAALAIRDASTLERQVPIEHGKTPSWNAVPADGRELRGVHRCAFFVSHDDVAPRSDGECDGKPATLNGSHTFWAAVKFGHIDGRRGHTALTEEQLLLENLLLLAASVVNSAYMQACSGPNTTVTHHVVNPRNITRIHNTRLLSVEYVQ